MKKILYPILLLACMAGAAACSDDLGNYSYHDINEIKLASDNDLQEGKTYNLIAFVDHLKFNPKIESSFGKTDEDDYEYEWRVMPSGQNWTDFDTTGITIARTRAIDIPVTLAPRKYSGFFNVKDKATGQVWTTQFSIQVRSITAEGWLILSDVNNESRLDIIYNRTETEDLIARDIFSGQTFRPGKPRRLIYNYQLGNQATLLVTDKGTFRLDRLDLHAGEDNNLIWQFGAPPEKVFVKASAISQYAGTNYWMIIDENDEFYTLNLSVAGSFFEFPVTMLNGTTKFRPAPFIGINISNNSWGDGMSGGHPGVLYDTDSRQFVQFFNNSMYPGVMEYSGTRLFDNPTGRDMLWMESTRSGIVRALLRDPGTGDTYHYAMAMYAEEIPPAHWWEDSEYRPYNQQKEYGKVSGPGLENATMFAFHHLYSYLFYVSGNEIYQLNLNDPNTPAKKVLSFPGETIKVMRFNPFTAWEPYADWERQRGYQLIVGTNIDGKPEDECGTVRFYEVPGVMQPLRELKKVDGFGNIVEIVYKERPKS